MHAVSSGDHVDADAAAPQLHTPPPRGAGSGGHAGEEGDGVMEGVGVCVEDAVTLGVFDGVFEAVWLGVLEAV